jgi:hypothetical protein
VTALGRSTLISITTENTLKGRLCQQAIDPDLAQQLWHLSEKMIGLDFSR